MKKLIDRPTYQIDVFSGSKLSFIAGKHCLIMDVKTAKKNEFDFISPAITNMNKAFWSENLAKVLFLNTTGSGLVYDLLNAQEIKKVKFGKEFYSQYFANYKNGFFYLEQDGIVNWFSLEDFKKKELPEKHKCWAIYDAKDSIYFFCITKEDPDALLNQLSLKIFSKKKACFEKQIDLPQGIVKNFRQLYDGRYLLTMKQPYASGCSEAFFIYNSDNNELDYLFVFKDLFPCYVEETIGCFCNLDIDEKNIYCLFSQRLLIFDSRTKKLISSYFIREASDLKIVDDILIISTWHGVYKISLKELYNYTEGSSLC